MTYRVGEKVQDYGKAQMGEIHGKIYLKIKDYLRVSGGIVGGSKSWFLGVDTKERRDNPFSVFLFCLGRRTKQSHTQLPWMHLPEGRLVTSSDLKDECVGVGAATCKSAALK